MSTITTKDGVEILYGLGRGSAHRVQPWLAAIGGRRSTQTGDGHDMDHMQTTLRTCRHLVTAGPETSYDNFLRDFGERFVPGYKTISAVDLLMNAAPVTV